MKTRYTQIIQFLEGLQIMPKSMPGLHKIKRALALTEWFNKLDPEKIIVVAGTNGKGSTCAMLEALLKSAGQKVGFYSSPHLVSTTERIRVNGEAITEENFIKLFLECESIIRSCSLSHFEALTLMAGHYFFSESCNENIDYAIFEVGLGGTYDATNAFPHRYSVITPIDIDHVNILGKSLADIAPNKFGIVHDQNIVVYQSLAPELENLKNRVLLETHSRGIPVDAAVFDVIKVEAHPTYELSTKWGRGRIAMQGARGAQNAMTALTTFAALGFDPALHLKALQLVDWRGRMQRVEWSGLACPLYLSGDHNSHGIKSLLDILKDYSWKTIHVVVGIGADKDAEEMLSLLTQITNSKVYLTVTPFKGLNLDLYPPRFLAMAEICDADPIHLLQKISLVAGAGDLIVVTGSLYLVGELLRKVTSNKEGT